MRSVFFSWKVFLLWCLGVIWRFQFIFVSHRAEDYVYSDMEYYFQFAKDLFESKLIPSPYFVYKPPFTSLFYGVLYELGGRDWTLVYLAQFLMSAAVPLLAAGIAKRLFDQKTAMISLVIASFYYPFINYAGYFLAESLVIFLLTLTAYLFVIEVVRTEQKSSTINSFFIGLGAISLVATKAVYALIGLIVIVGCFYFFCYQQKRRFPLRFIPALIPVVFVSVLMAEYCTRLNNDSFCVADNFSSASFVIGHLGPLQTVVWRDNGRDGPWASPPVFVQKGYRKEFKVPHPFYDSKANYRVVKNRLFSQPWKSFVRASTHILDLFYGSYPWPGAAQGREKKLIIGYTWFYWYIILLPAVLLVIRCCESQAFRKSDGGAIFLLSIPLFALMLAAFVAYGDPRYRIPVDVLTLIVAARYFAIGRSSVKSASKANLSGEGSST